jgi:4-hydroxybutyryl-CoA dehydratase / vinylacetyl-CoA-Delta-isomerase
MQDRIESVETLWADFATPIRTAEDYINSLRGRRMNVFFMGERVPEPADHPVIRPSINAMAETYRLARRTSRRCIPTSVTAGSTASSTCR